METSAHVRIGEPVRFRPNRRRRPRGGRSTHLEYGAMSKFQAISDFAARRRLLSSGPSSDTPVRRTGKIAGVAVPRRILDVTLLSGGEATHRAVAIDDLVVAGWTGRDPAAVEKHIRELEALGVKRPATTPIFYRVSAARLTTDAEIEVVGDKSGGEAEFVLLRHGGRLWVGAGSDHTDREVETYGVTVSKQMCDKPVAPLFWSFDEVAPHWDRLMLRAHVGEGGARVLYQEGSVAAMLAPEDLLARHLGDAQLADNTLMFCGTLAAKGGVRPTAQFEFELEDPVRQRKIAHAYTVRRLPILG
jgi:hypothetical protein